MQTFKRTHPVPPQGFLRAPCRASALIHARFEMMSANQQPHFLPHSPEHLPRMPHQLFHTGVRCHSPTACSTLGLRTATRDSSCRPEAPSRAPDPHHPHPWLLHLFPKRESNLPTLFHLHCLYPPAPLRILFHTTYLTVMPLLTTLPLHSG